MEFGYLQLADGDKQGESDKIRLLRGCDLPPFAFFPPASHLFFPSTHLFLFLLAFLQVFCGCQALRQFNFLVLDLH